MKAMDPKTGASFDGALRYGLGKEGAELVGGNMAGDNPKDLALEFKEVANMRLKEVPKPVWHGSLSLPEGEKLSDEKAREIGEEYLTRIGCDTSKHQWCLIRHTDNAFDHYHIYANRIDQDGGLWYARDDLTLGITACQALEKKYGLQRTPGREGGKEIGVKLSKEERQQAKRLGVEHPKKTLASRINSAIEKSDGSLKDFTKACEQNGVKVNWNIASTGKINGARFELEDSPEGFYGTTYKGSDLGKGYVWKDLNNRLEIQAERHQALGATVEGQQKEKGREVDLDIKPKSKARDKDKGWER